MKDAKSSMVIWFLLLSLVDVFTDFAQESVVVWSGECVAPLAARTFAVAHRCVPFGWGWLVGAVAVPCVPHPPSTNRGQVRSRPSRQQAAGLVLLLL
jgi:hypothetical protein